MFARSSVFSFSLLLGCNAGISVSGTANSPKQTAEPSPDHVKDFKISTSEGSGNELIISWDEVDGVTSYDLIVAHDSECKIPFVQFKGIQVNTQSISIADSSKYYACVFGNKADGSVIPASNNGFALSSMKGKNDVATSEPTNSETVGPDASLPDTELDQTPPVPRNSGTITTNGIAANSVTLSWTGATDNVTAAASLQYKVVRSLSNNIGNLTDATKNGILVQDWTTNLTSLNLTGLSSKTVHYFNVMVMDARANQSIYAGIQQATPNVAPTFSFSEPLGTDDSVEKASSFAITWSDSDPDDDASISLYYKTINSGACTASSTLITAGISENSVANSHSWDTTGVPSDIYYICARITDDTAPAIDVYSDRIAVYPNGSCIWSGYTSTAWSTAGNWVNCGGTAPASTSRVLITATPSNQPTVTAATTIDSFASDTNGGGTVTVDHVILTLNNSTSETFASSVILKGSNDTCTDCTVERNGHIYIVDGATLTLGRGIKMQIASSSRLYVGSATEVGHLRASGDPAQSTTWPIITSISGSTFGITVDAPSGGVKSSVHADGFKILNQYNSEYGLYFGNYYEVKNLDNVRFETAPGTNKFIPYLRLSSCTNGVITDSTWDNWHLSALIAGGSSNVQVNANCTTNINITNSTGAGIGEIYDNDPNNIVTWTPDPVMYTCVWNAGSSGTDWHDAAKWSNCNDRGGVPDSFDWVDIPAGANQPVLSQSATVQGMTGTGGGTVTIGPGVDLFFMNAADTITANATFVGSTTTCTTCQLRMANLMTIVNGATVTIGKGITVTGPGAGNVPGGVVLGANGTKTGHLVVQGGSNPIEWPHFKFNTPNGNPILTNGQTTGHSTLMLDGVHVSRLLQGGGLLFANNTDILALNNIKFSSHANTYFTFQNCSTLSIPAVLNNINFDYQPNVNRYSIDMSNADCAAASISVTGGGVAYGPTYENDPGDTHINWSSTCGGTTVANYCWYLGANGESCDTVCTGRGGVQHASYWYAGSGAGNNTNCDTVLEALLGAPITTNATSVPTGVSCAYNGTDGKWSNATTTYSATDPSHRRACACQQ